MTTAPAGVQLCPTDPQRIPFNRWDLLEPPALGTWEPTLHVSVVIPYFQRQLKLARTLQALAAQTYPSAQFEVLIVDDGSQPPLVLPEGHLGLDLKVLSQPRRGFGAGRARNLGARASRGSVLVFLDCDMIPEPAHLEAHARWHHVCDHAVTLGSRLHVDIDDLSAEAVGEAAARASLQQLFEGRPWVEPAWIEAHLERTDQLRGPQDDLFRVVTSGNLGVGKAFFDGVGGFDESFGQWGGEDTELGYRLFTAGGLLVSERRALCWHQGAGVEPSAEELQSLDEQRALLAHLIAHRGFRRLGRGRSFTVPRVVVLVDVSSQTRRSDVVATVESVLASDLHDVTLALTVEEEHPDRVWLVRQFDGDPRVVTNATDVASGVPFGIELPVGTVLEPSALDRLLEPLLDGSGRVGVVRSTIPGRRPSQEHATAWSTRASSRAELGGAVGRDAQLREVAELFGDTWVSGLDAGLAWVTGHQGTPPALEDPSSSGEGDLQKQANELWTLLSRMDERHRNDVVGTAKTVLGTLSGRQLSLLLRSGRRGLAVFLALAGLRRVRGPRTLRRSCGELARAILPTRVIRFLRLSG